MMQQATKKDTKSRVAKVIASADRSKFNLPTLCQT